MKRNLLFVVMSLFAMVALAQTKVKDHVEVMYFHGKQSISTPEGAKIAKDYRVTWSSLFVNGWKNGKEKRNDMTQFAFKNARKHADEFKKGVKGKIKAMMK